MNRISLTNRARAKAAKANARSPTCLLLITCCGRFAPLNLLKASNKKTQDIKSGIKKITVRTFKIFLLRPGYCKEVKIAVKMFNMSPA